MHTVNKQLLRMGWRPRSEDFWDYFAQVKPKYAIIAPPRDSIPSSSGNAIYTLVEYLAFRFPEPVIVLARRNTSDEKISTTISEKILYINTPLLNNEFKRWIPYRIKKKYWGSTVENVKSYLSLAGNACRVLGIKSAIVEDEPLGCINFLQKSKGINLYLHQHSIGMLGLSRKEFLFINENAQGVIFVSKHGVQLVEDKFDCALKRYEVVYNGVDLEEYNPFRLESQRKQLLSRLNLKQNQRILLFVGRIIPQKGIMEALEAFLLANLPNTVFIIIGEINIEKNLENSSFLHRIIELATQNPSKVILTGRILQKELPKYYNIADIVIVPSIGQEGLPKVITESLAMGIPVMASNRGGNWEMIQNNVNGWRITDPKDIQGMAKEINEAFLNYGRLIEMKQFIIQNWRFKMDERAMVSTIFSFLRSTPNTM